MNLSARSILLKLFTASHHAVNGVIIPFLPLMFNHKGYSYWQIGLLLAVGGIVNFLTQIWWGYICDKLQTIKKILLMQILIAALLSLFIFRIDNFNTFFILFVVFSIFYRPIMANIDVLTLSHIEGSKQTYSGYRLYGSLGFAVSAFISGFVLKQYGIEVGSYLITATLLANFLIGLIMFDAKYKSSPPRFNEFLKVMQNSQLIWFLVVTTLILTTHITNDNFIGIHIQNLGGTVDQTGLAWTIGVIAEVITFAALPWLARHNSDLSILKLASVLYLIRWLLLALITTVNLVIAVQVLHGICFALFWATLVNAIHQLVPENLKATGQGVRYMFYGIATVLGSLGAGLVLDATSDQFMYLCCAALTIIAIVGFRRVKI
jgi:PPP family 3-phenylpropionic acid transporter